MSLSIEININTTWLRCEKRIFSLEAVQGRGEKKTSNKHGSHSRMASNSHNFTTKTFIHESWWQKYREFGKSARCFSCGTKTFNTCGTKTFNTCSRNNHTPFRYFHDFIKDTATDIPSTSFNETLRGDVFLEFWGVSIFFLSFFFFFKP